MSINVIADCVFVQGTIQYLQKLGDSPAAWAPAACPLVLDSTPSYDSAAGQREQKYKQHCLNEGFDKQNKSMKPKLCACMEPLPA